MYELAGTLFNTFIVTRNMIDKETKKTHTHTHMHRTHIHMQIYTYASHTRTIVRECCKGDDASQRENGIFDPLENGLMV